MYNDVGYNNERVSFDSNFNKVSISVHVNAPEITDNQKLAINEAVKMITAAMKEKNVQ